MREFVVKHRYSKEEWEEDAADFRHGIPLDKFLYSRMRRALSMQLLAEEVQPVSGYWWYYEGICDIEAGYCDLILRYAYDPEEKWIIKKADIPENRCKAPEHLKSNPAHLDYVWDYVQEHFSVEDIANLRNKAEQTLKLL